jgi:hypothetical protein
MNPDFRMATLNQSNTTRLHPKLVKGGNLKDCPLNARWLQALSLEQVEGLTIQIQNRNEKLYQRT